MKGDAASAPFIGARIKEIVSESLNTDREDHIQILAEELAQKASECLEYQE